jgi:4-amino-4-deoxy-L-arabinose transferase-like glycosyltransferase
MKAFMVTQTSSTPAVLRTPQPSSRRTLLLSLIVLIWAIIYLGSLFQPALLDDADTVHAEAAREMAEVDHDWVTLHINNGFRYLEKAPLIYWAVAVSFKLFGVHDWSARLPVALGVLALLLVVYRLGRRVFIQENQIQENQNENNEGEEAGLYSALVLATGFGPFIFTRIMIPDMAVALWLALGFDFFLTTLEQAEAGQKPSRWPCWGIAATMALNVLTKGLIGLVFPIVTILIFLLLTGRLRHLLKLHLLSSFIVFLAIAAPWHLLAGLRNPAQGQARGFFWFYFVNEHFLRYLKKRYPADYDTVPLWLFWGLNLLWLMPWTAFLIQAVREIPVRARSWRAAMSREQQGTLLFALWMLVVMVFFSFSSRQEYYVIAGIPGLALLLGGWLAKETGSPLASRERRSGKISSAVLMAIGAAACIAAILLVFQSKTPPANYDIADLLKKNPQEYELSFGHFLDLTPQAMGAFKVPLLLTGIAFGAGTLLNWLLRRINRTFAANMVLALMMVMVLLAAHSGLVIFSPVLSSKKLADTIESHWAPGAVIETNGDYETASSVNYYTHRQIRMLNGRCNNIWYGSVFPDAPQVFDDDTSFVKLWRTQQTVFLLTAENAVAKDSESAKCPQDDRLPVDFEKEKACLLAKWGGKLVLTNERKLCPAPAPPR